jgi:hypothetical protein
MFYATPSAPPPTRPDRKAILYSAAIFPGVGQYHQRRLAAALLYGGVGALASLLFLAMLGRHGPSAIRILRGAWTWGVNPDDVREVYGPILKTGAFLVGVYLANVYDAWYAWYRALRAWRAAAAQNENRI